MGQGQPRTPSTTRTAQRRIHQEGRAAKGYDPAGKGVDQLFTDINTILVETAQQYYSQAPKPTDDYERLHNERMQLLRQRRAARS
eukprot:627137-Pyramimonas_sp.AAC.1